MIKTILKYGLACGLVVSIYLNIGYELGLMYRTDGLRYLVYLGIVIHPLAVFFALLELKKKHYKDKLPFVPALLTGLLTSVLAGIIYCLFTYIDIHWLDMRQYKELIDLQAREMVQQGKTIAEITAETEAMRARYLSYKPYTATMWWYIKMGGIYTLVTYLFINIKRPKNENTKTAAGD